MRYWAQISSPRRRWMVLLSTEIINLKTFITDKTAVDTFPEIFRQFSTFMRRTRRRAQAEAISQKSWNKSNSISWVNKTDEKIEKLFRVEKLTIFSNYLNCIKSSSHTFVDDLEKSRKCFHFSHTHRRKLSTFSRSLFSLLHASILIFNTFCCGGEFHPTTVAADNNNDTGKSRIVCN